MRPVMAVLLFVISCVWPLAEFTDQVPIHHGPCLSEESVVKGTGRLQHLRCTVAPHGFSSGLPALKIPVMGLRDLPVGAPRGRVVFTP